MTRSCVCVCTELCHAHASPSLSALNAGSLFC
uniref:Uncharacterized protein n=1 Tax=Anguilla anguilla TaxID=7936 RepID=A0A0E9VX87_ANGAN